MERMQFIKTDQEGNKIICEVIATYHDDDINKDFIVYTDNTYDENHKLRIFYSLYTKENDKIILDGNLSIEEKKIGLELIKEIIQDFPN